MIILKCNIMKTKRKRLWKTAIAALFLAALIGGCKKDDFVEIAGVCPVVISTDPANEATGVPLDKIITATFNEPINPVTITPASFSRQSGAKGLVALTGTLTYDGTNATMSFKPTTRLTINTTYTATVKASVKDFMGTPLQADYVWTFSTGATLSPTVISTDPANNATGVVLNKIVTATFNQLMDPLSLTAATFTIKQGTTPVAGAVTYTGRTASFKPTSAFTANTIYTATITTGAKNVPGITLANDYVWTFTTGTI